MLSSAALINYRMWDSARSLNLKPAASQRQHPMTSPFLGHLPSWDTSQVSRGLKLGVASARTPESLFIVNAHADSRPG